MLISIHAPLTGSDGAWIRFNPLDGFQSTLPLRGATATQVGACTHMFISIHAPLTGSDKWE